MSMFTAAIIGVVGGLLVGSLIALLNPDRPWLGLIVGISLPCAVLAGAATGTLIPFACHRVHVDPAYAGGPFLSTMNDVSGYLVYFLVALGMIRLLPLA